MLKISKLSPVKLTNEPRNFLTTTNSTVLESLSLYLVSKRLRLSHLPQHTSGISVDNGISVDKFEFFIMYQVLLAFVLIYEAGKNEGNYQRYHLDWFTN